MKELLKKMVLYSLIINLLYITNNNEVDHPITALEIISAGEFRCSPGFSVIDKCMGGILPACITRDDCDFYIAYRKVCF